MRIFVIRSSPTLALLGQSKDRIRNSVLDKTWNLVHQFSAQNCGIESLRFGTIAARQAYMAQARKPGLLDRRKKFRRARD
jgi:hypothetical protein